MSQADLEKAEREAREGSPGRSLIRVGDDPGLSLAERLAYRLHRLAWATPLHGLRLRGRAPLRLLAVPKDPVAGDKAAGEALLSGLFVHGEVEVALGDLAATKLPPGAAEHFHSFAWLRDLAAAATRERGVEIAEQLTRLWLHGHGQTVASPAWRADLWGRRILFWTAYAPYILSSRDSAYRAGVLTTLARGARHLERTADKAPQGIARLTAWSGVIAAALVVQGGPTRLKTGEAGLQRAVELGLHDDGGLVSRSPVEQIALVEILGQLRAVYFAGGRDMPDWLAEAAEGAVAALLSVTCGDETLSSWQAGNPASRRRLAAVLEGSGVAAGPLRQARGWGYQRFATKKSLLILDAAPPPPPRAFSGGCASTLAFEFSEGVQRLIVNCGGEGDRTGALPQHLAHALRSTAAHSTLTLGDRNSTAIHEDGTLGKGVTQVELVRDETAGVGRLEASHDGYLRRFGLIHERRLNLSADGKSFTGEDRLIPGPKRRRADAVPFAARFHLAPGIEVARTADGQGALLRVQGGGAWQFRSRGGQLDVEDSLWIDGHARLHATLQLVVTGEVPPDGHTLAWELKRAG